MADLSANGCNHIWVAGKAEITEEEHWPSDPQPSRLMMSLYQTLMILILSRYIIYEQKDGKAAIFGLALGKIRLSWRSAVSDLAQGQDPP